MRLACFSLRQSRCSGAAAPSRLTFLIPLLRRPAGCPYADGDVVYCATAQLKLVVRVENGTARRYPTRASWELDGSPPPIEKSEAACDKLANCPGGEPMPDPGAERGAAAGGPACRPGRRAASWTAC